VPLPGGPDRRTGPEATLPASAKIEAVRAYIKQGWTTLTRSTRDLPAAAVDPKLHLPAGRPFPVYLSPREDRARIEKGLRERLGADYAKIELRVLPPDWRSSR
jgi:hypothetical protein